MHLCIQGNFFDSVLIIREDPFETRSITVFGAGLMLSLSFMYQHSTLFFIIIKTLKKWKKYFKMAGSIVYLKKSKITNYT